MDIVTKKKLNILIQLAQADKDFALVERDLIYQIARERNFPAEGVDNLIEHPEPIGTLGALSPKQKLDYLMAAVEMIFADHQVLHSEVLFTRHLAIKLGFLKDVVDYLVENFDKLSSQELEEKVRGEFMLN